MYIFTYTFYSICILVYTKKNMEQLLTFKALSDETRVRALLLLSGEEELCVCELVHALEISQPKISRHMAALRDAGIVSARREAQWVYYSINPELSDWQAKIVEGSIESGCGEKIVQSDRERLLGMKNRPIRRSFKESA